MNQKLSFFWKNHTKTKVSGSFPTVFIAVKCDIYSDINRILLICKRNNNLSRKMWNFVWRLATNNILYAVFLLVFFSFIYNFFHCSKPVAK